MSCIIVKIWVLDFKYTEITSCQYDLTYAQHVTIRFRRSAVFLQYVIMTLSNISEDDLSSIDQVISSL